MPHKPNPYDRVLETLVEAMTQVDDHLKAMTQDVRPFDSQQLTPEEDDLLFHNPAARYQGQVDPTTGLPLTNAQASQKLLADLGPQAYVEYVDDYVRRADRRNGGDASLNPPLDTPAPAPSYTPPAPPPSIQQPDLPPPALQ